MSLEASIVVDAVLRADIDGSKYDLMTPLTVNFLEIFEPTLDGFERIVAAMEHCDIYSIFHWAFWGWVDKVDPRDLGETFEQQELRLWRAVESWDSPSRAFKAVDNALSEGFDDWYNYASHAREMTAGWKDQSKREFVIAKFQEVIDELEAESEKQYMEEHGWKYCPHGMKHWDCPDCCDAWHAGFEPIEDPDEEVQDA